MRRDFPTPTVEQALASRMPQTAWWGASNDTLERATIMLPELFYDRMEALGFDFDRKTLSHSRPDLDPILSAEQQQENGETF